VTRTKAFSPPGPLRQLLDQGGLYPVFQPLVDLRDGTVFGHEALIRGPADSPLHMPLDLLQAAERESLMMAFELRCVDVILQQWGRLRLPHRLFLNMSADALVHAMNGDSPDSLERMLTSAGVPAPHLVVELTEHERVSDSRALRQAVKCLHATGARFALDDFGDGHSSLRLWAELKPDIVKIDKFFTRSIASSTENLEMVRAICSLSEVFGTQLVAEGIETGDDLRVLRDLRIAYGQGWLLGRPAPQPVSEAPAAVTDVVTDNRIAVMPTPERRARPGVLRGLQLNLAPSVDPATTNDEVSVLFQEHPEFHALAVVDDGRPVALIHRQAFMNHYARLYFREVHGRKPCVSYANRAPRVVELDVDVQDLIGILTSEDQRYLSEGFIITEKGRYLGLGTGDQLVRAVTETRIEAARHANPLTFLPGNIPISMHIERLLDSGADFVACYSDLNNFKPFNDHYGYWRGDEMIRIVAKLLTQHSDARRDFVGHVGGDDFIILFQSRDWERRCRLILDDFARQAFALYDEPDRAAGGIEEQDRHGSRRFFAFTTMCIGAVRIAAGTCRQVEDVANEASLAKHDAKMAVSGLALRSAALPARPSVRVVEAAALIAVASPA
jgi:EAL domain-containing protein (putative c-di-GMP-specific phosphodiesterase class I)/GGDEF domain-containing protein